MSEPTSPNQPLEMLAKGALEALVPCEKVLRTYGWDTTKVIHNDGDGVMRVCLEIRVSVLVPIENAVPA